MEHRIKLPINGIKSEILSNQSFVIIGANGSGKSRLGKYIEDNTSDGNSYRISAQRALTIPDFVSLKSFEEASDLLLYGTTNKNTIEQKNKGFKWGWDGYENKLIDDFDNLLSSVFALKNKENDKFVQACKENERLGIQHPNAPITIIDRIIEIWTNIMPHREIILADAKVAAKHHGVEYHGRNLSDGERVALYLLAQSLCVPDGYVIIVDEPEIHLHPEWQIKFAELIVLLQKEFKMHILLTTHSPYFLKAVQVYSKKYKISNKCKYYMSELDGEQAILVDKTNNLEDIFYQLTIPFENLMNEEELL